MKLFQWFKSRSTQEWMMIAVVVMLLAMIVSRWAYISHTAGKAIHDRFVPAPEQTDSLR